MTKETYSEIKYFPIPDAVAGILRRSGMNFYCYYENARSGVKDWSRLRSFHFYCLLQMLDGDGALVDDDHPEPVPFGPGQGVIVTPGMRQEYGAVRNFFVEDSICFFGPVADALLQAGIIRPGIINFGRERRLLPIIDKIRSGTLTAFLEASLMLQQLLMDLHRHNRTDGDSVSHHHLERLLEQIGRDPRTWWTVRDMAEFCNLSENHLRRLFHHRTGMAPKEYLEQVKMRHAAEMLAASELKIAEIADRLGYRDPYHFIRRFTLKTGMSPGRYRRHGLYHGLE